ncbi:MAG: filamentous hemagglutinin N-terminal domain-containing protein [Nitrospira sp.]|nr:filamentous hemagglutinin N-terminal domain-containing protein [Nitrospira sp.]
MHDSPNHTPARVPKTGPASYAFSKPSLRRERIFCGLLAAVHLLVPCLTLALPTDGRVAGGGATLQSTPKSITIQQTTDKAILNWKSFSIAADEAVHFRQPSADAIALNRVIGGDPSVILGRLQANGRIFLLNPNGIFFGAGAQINVGGLLASTLHTRDEEFMAGRYLFAQDPLKGLKTVVNQGRLQVSEHGFVILAAPAVSNEGIIVANLGTTLLGSGQKLTVDLMGDGLINYALAGKVLEQVTGIDETAPGSAVKNSGTIHADGGQVILQASAAGDIFSSVVNQSGVVRARSLTHEDGIVRLDGGNSGQVTVAGSIDASGPAPGRTGGRVSLLGESVTLTPTARIDVSGDGGGGTALIGGQFQGRGTEPAATTTRVADRASISADALTQGPGGTVIVWADEDTQYAGTISARGGTLGGHGGFVEVSGKQALDFTGRVDTTAPAGNTGTLLLDPSNITISSAANANISAAPTFTGTTATSTLNVTTLQTALATNNVIVDTTSPFASAGNITVSNAVTWSSANSLDLRAHNTITVNAGLSSTGLGILRLIGDQDGIGGGNVALNAAISARLGGIEISGDGITSGTAGTITTTGLASGDAGHITINATGAVNLRGAVTANGGTAGADTSGRAGGTVAITGVGVTTGTLTANGSHGNGADQPGGAGGTLSITSTGSHVRVGTISAIGGNALAGNANGGNGGSVSLDAGGATPTITHQTVTTTGGNRIGSGTAGTGGDISVADASLLSAATTIAAGGGSAGAGTGGHVTFGNTVDSSGSNRTLAVNTNGITTFTGAVGETFALTSLATDAPGSVRVGGNVTTTGVQTYNDPLTLLAHSTMTGTTPTFGSTLTGGGFDLTLNFSGTTVINGAAFTGINQFVSGNGGTTSLTGAFSTTGAQTFGDAVTLAGGTTLTSSGNHDITFNSTVNGARALAVNTTGTTTFGGPVGTTTALTSLTTDSGGTTAVNGGAVTTSGNQTYNDAVTMNQLTTVASTGGAITFAEHATNTLAGAGLTVEAPTLSLTSGKTVATTGSGPIRFLTNSFNPNGANIDAGTGAFTLSPTTLTNTIEFGDVNTARATTVYYGSLFGSLTAGSFTIGRPTHSGNIFVTGVAAAPSSIQIVNGGAGAVTFENSPYVGGNQSLGVTGGTGGITIGQDLTLGTGTLRLTTTGAISQTAGTLIAETAGVSATSGITLAQPLNDVVTLAARTTAGDLTFTNNNGFTIGAVTATADGFHPAVTGVSAGGAITLQSGGAVTQTQRILGSSLRLLGSGPFMLTDHTNEVTAFSANTTDHVQYTDASDVILGTSNIPDHFDLTTSGAITQSGALTVTGRTTLAAGASDITLTQPGNNFSRVDITSANHVALTDSDALVLGASTVNGTLDIATNGALTQSGALTVGGAATLASGSYDITLIEAGNDFNSVSITGGNHVSLTDTNALRLATSTITGNLHAHAGTLTIGGALTSSGGNLTLTGTNSVTQLAHLSVTGAHTITVTAPSGPLAMAPTATTSSDTGAIAYAAGADITLGSLRTGAGVTVISSGGSVLSTAGSGMNVTAGANSSLQALNGVVGTQVAPITVHVSAGTLGIHATAARFGISAFLNGTVFPGQALTMLNAPPGLVCFNACRFGTIPSFNVASAIPWYMRHASNPLWYSILSTYLPEDVVEGTRMDVFMDKDHVAREIPPCTPTGACAPEATILTPPSGTEDATAY